MDKHSSVIAVQSLGAIHTTYGLGGKALPKRPSLEVGVDSIFYDAAREMAD